MESQLELTGYTNSSDESKEKWTGRDSDRKGKRAEEGSKQKRTCTVKATGKPRIVKDVSGAVGHQNGVGVACCCQCQQ
jgi:hypothetical protein